ncbi:metallopeptidase family protein [Cellulosimicrobium sp. Marseille-Q8652]
MRGFPSFPGSRPEPAGRGRRSRDRAAGRRPVAPAEQVPGDPSSDDLDIPLRAPGPGGHGPAARRRDRRGRGIRGPLLPPSAPANRTRAERFDDVVVEVVERVERAWAKQLRGTEFAVEDVPPSDPAPWEQGGVPLGRCFPAESGQPARVVVYRRPVEARALDAEDLEDLVRDVVVEQVAHLLARSPEEIDPRYTGDH